MPTVPTTSAASQREPWLGRFAILLAISILGLIFLGGLVKSHEAGLSVPDWPTSYGHNMFLFPPDQWIGTIWYEHVHRLVASVIGLMTVVLAFWIAAVETRRVLKYLAAAAVLLVIIQGALGGLTVLMQLPPIVSATHGVIAQTFLMLVILIAHLLHRPCGTEAVATRELALVSLVTVLLVYLQLVIGAVMRHNGAGLAIPDFPTMGGTLLPTFSSEWYAALNKLRQSIGLGESSSFQISVHLLHRGLAVLVLIAIVLLTRFTLQVKNLPTLSRRLALSSLALVVVQLTLGVATVLTVRNPFIASLHVVFGAALLAIVWLHFLRIRGVAAQS